MKKTNSKGKSSIAKRNPLTLNPLMKKSHAHTKTTKVERSKGKQILNKALRDGNAENQ